MTSRHWGLIGGLAIFLAMLVVPAPAGMPEPAWRAAAIVVLMAAWWITEALPLTATALLPFLLFPAFGIMDTKDTAGAYWSPILFLVLGGAFLALAIERTGLHRRLALAILARGGRSAGAMLFAFMVATALISMFVSNTATALIMIPIAAAVLGAIGAAEGETDGLPGAMMMGVAFAASIGGLGTLVGSPTNAIAAGLIERTVGYRIDFLTWAAYGVPLVLLAIPLAWVILMHVQKVRAYAFDGDAAHAAIGAVGPWSIAEARLVPIVVLVVAGWVIVPLIPGLPPGRIEDGTVAILGGLLLFVIPDGTGRPLLNWKEADRAPWGVMMMYGGGLALASGLTKSGLAAWLGVALAPLADVDPLIVALTLTALVVFATEFASNVATAAAVMPVVAGLIAATGADPALLAIPAAMAASWGFMLPSGSAPNAIAWTTGHIALPRILRAGLYLDLAGVPLMVAIAWAIGQVMR